MNNDDYSSIRECLPQSGYGETQAIIEVDTHEPLKMIDESVVDAHQALALSNGYLRIIREKT